MEYRMTTKDKCEQKTNKKESETKKAMCERVKAKEKLREERGVEKRKRTGSQRKTEDGKEA